jgi:hypothetical protein
MLRRLASAGALLCALFWATAAGAVCTTKSTAGFADAAVIASLNELCGYLSTLNSVVGTHNGIAGNNTYILNPVDGTAVDMTAPAQVYVSNSYINITTKTTTPVKLAPGTLGCVTINKTGSADTIAIYDSLAASGTLVATITSPTVGMNLCYNVAMGIGITIVTGGTTAGDYTVAYR